MMFMTEFDSSDTQSQQSVKDTKGKVQVFEVWFSHVSSGIHFILYYYIPDVWIVTKY